MTRDELEWGRGRGGEGKDGVSLHVDEPGSRDVGVLTLRRAAAAGGVID